MDTRSTFAAVAAASLLLLIDPISAQTIDYPSSMLASPPTVTFPFYTPGAGSGSQTVRAQFLCPDAWLASQNLAAGLVTRIGFSLAGQAVYDTFELRAGTSTVTTLSGDWTVNLPDQRVQRNLAMVPIQGGGTATNPTNQWVEFDLDYPFHWQPGQSIVVDLTTHILTPGTYLGTTSGSPTVTRAYNFNYSNGSPATNFTGYGAAFRMVFATTDLVPFGAGCIGQSGVVPVLTSVGDASLGNTMTVLANQTLEPTLGGFLVGFSRTTTGTLALPLSLGGSCTLLVAPDVFLPAAITPVGGGLGTSGFAITVPNDPLLVGTVLYTQWTQFDGGAPGTVPLTFSHGGMVVVF